MNGSPLTPTLPDQMYSSRCRTALVLTGAGTAGVYHAGVLKALTEAGVRVDVVAGQGIGVAGACFAAIDGGARLWGDEGCWRDPAVASFYGWRPAVRALGWAIGAALATVVVPVIVVAGGSLVFLAAFLLGLAGVDAASGLADQYTALVHDAFLPDRLPTWIPQLALLLLASVFGILIVAAWRGRLRGRYREQGAFWWRVFGAPLSAGHAIRFWRSQLWRTLVGGAHLSEPEAVDLSRRYAQAVNDNLGQPGFRELIAVVHDLDSRQDVTLAALIEPYRHAYFGRGPGSAGWSHRAGETLDLVGVDRDHGMDVLAASLCLPVATTPWAMTFAPESFWRGETHRLCDRPGSVARLLEEVRLAGAEQVILVTAAPATAAPHSLAAPRIDAAGKLGEWLASQETAAVRDALAVCRPSFRRLYVICPDHNPIGPFDVGGAYDERSDRVQFLPEVLDRGYADAYRQFIEPVVGASDDPPRDQAGPR